MTPRPSHDSSAPIRLRRRVAVTGMGAITPLGLNVNETWQGLVAGRSGVGPITRFDASKLSTRIAAEVKGFSIEKFISSKEARRMGLFTQYALAATMEALEDAKLKVPFTASESPINPRRVGISIASGMGGLPEIEYWDRELLRKDKKTVSPFFVPIIIPNMASGHLSISFGTKGPNVCLVTACASSAHALGESARYIREGIADIMIAGGAEAVISELGIVGFASMKALSCRNEEPSKASRPYDKNRDGFVMGEGAVTLILEELEHAKRRGATIYAELVGYGISSDAFHMTSPAPEGQGAAECMQAALDDAGMAPSEIDYINTHGTSTPTGDGLEALGVARVFHTTKDKLHVSSTKSMTGHLLGAAGAMEAAVCVLAIKEGIIPPTINLDEPDEDAIASGLNFTPHRSVRKPVNAALTNSFGFGGTNACLIFRKYTP